ncbi:YbaB/EbfC family nucleoid-associated protein [Streptoalloteichus hindustanus]|uniref:YbaB/EbfC DNA-binding family protein n=1 Tax=Streptoalloteichus hindustanus TaxID=2017 RepID=A0A1M5ESD8_STRHI|nr:YbaB/EbfC family nucleoid-associated protein [Streptoalloteichus hindustanus]SHF82175.1 YbaB/EbfC DNA-binding family protein [Streptoalloteichus hindustanus]
MDNNIDPEKAGAELEKWAAQLEQRASRYLELQQRLDSTTVSETSADGTVRVTVDAHGVPVELHLSERARGTEPAKISAQLMACLRRAQAKLAHQVDGLVRATVPGDDAPANSIIENYRKRFPDPPEGLAPQDIPATASNATIQQGQPDRGRPPAPRPPQAPVRRPGPDEDTDDWADRSFLR